MGQVVFITGASRGIGRAIAEKFLEEGYTVIGTSTSGKSPYSHSHLHMVELDLGSPRDIEKCIENFSKLKKKIDILINNASTLGTLAPWSDDGKNIRVEIDQLRRVFEVNVIGTADLTERLLPFLKKPGKIINISSRAGSFGWKGPLFRNQPDYRMSKAALNMYTRTLANRLKDENIIVASIHPGWVKTYMGGKDADLEPKEAAEQIYRTIFSLKETGEFWFNQKKFPW